MAVARNDARSADVLVLFGITGDLARKLVLPALYRLVERGELTVPVDRGGAHRPGHRRPAPSRRGLRRRRRSARRSTPPCWSGCSPASTWWPATTPTRRCSPRLAEAITARPARTRSWCTTWPYRRRCSAPWPTVIAAAGLDDRIAAGGGEAVRSRPRVRPRARRPAAPPLPGGSGVPRRPLPGQGAGRGPARAAVRQHAARAAVEPAVDRPLRDHHGRGLRRRRPRLVLRRRRHRPRCRPEPPAPGARLPAHGPAAVGCGGRPARRQAPAAAGHAHRRPGRGGARPVRRLPDTPGRRAGFDHRDLRRAHPARRRLAVGRRARVPPRRQGTAHDAARRGRRAAPAAPRAVHRRRPPAGPTSCGCACSPTPGSRLRCWPSARAARTSRFRCRSPSTFRQVLGPMHAAYERILADALRGDPAHFARMDNLEEAWRIVGPILDSPEPPAGRTRGDRGGRRPPRRCPARRAGSSCPNPRPDDRGRARRGSAPGASRRGRSGTQCTAARPARHRRRVPGLLPAALRVRRLDRRAVRAVRGDRARGAVRGDRHPRGRAHGPTSLPWGWVRCSSPRGRLPR